jgi:hypothetical protein
MATLESWMPQDLKIANRYIDKARTLRGILAESGSPGLLSLVDSLTRATVQFGRCELHMHGADRRAALNGDDTALAASGKKQPTYVAERNVAAGTNAGTASSAAKRAMAYHTRGLEELANAKPGLTQFLKEVSSVDEQAVAKTWKGIEPGLKASWLEALGDLDMKPSDAKKLNKVMNECCAAAETGLKGLGGYIGKQFEELERLRKTPTRGTEDNWPYWKLVAVAIWLGMTVAGVVLALQRGAAWWEVAMIILIGLIGTLLLAFGC